jgi:hypothetical protein
MTFGIVDGIPVAVEDGADPGARLTDVATMMVPGSHAVAVFVPVGAIDWGAEVKVTRERLAMEVGVESVGSTEGLVRVTVPLAGPVYPVDVENAFVDVMVAFDGVVNGPVELDADVVGNVVPLVWVAMELGAEVVPVAVPVPVPMMLDRMPPRPVDVVVVAVVAGGGGPRSEDSKFPGALVELLLPEEDVPVGTPSRGGMVKLSPRRPPPPEEEEAEEAGAGVAVAVLAWPDVPGPNRPPRRLLSKLSLLVVLEELGGVAAAATDVTIPLGPKVIAEECVDFAEECEVVWLLVCVVDDGVGWMMMGGMRPEVPVGLRKSDSGLLPVSPKSLHKLFRPLSRARFGETGLAGAALLTTRLICRGK